MLPVSWVLQWWLSTYTHGLSLWLRLLYSMVISGYSDFLQGGSRFQNCVPRGPHRRFTASSDLVSVLKHHNMAFPWCHWIQPRLKGKGRRSLFSVGKVPNNLETCSKISKVYSLDGDYLHSSHVQKILTPSQNLPDSLIYVAPGSGLRLEVWSSNLGPFANEAPAGALP